MLVIATFLLVGQCQPEAPGWARRFIGEQDARVLESPTAVELYRVSGISTRGRDTLDSYAVVSHRSVELSDARELADIVLSDESLKPKNECRNGVAIGSIKLCGPFHPNVIYRVHSGSRWVDLLLCFWCGDLGVISARETLRIRDDSGGDDRLLALTARLLPDDPWLSHRAKQWRLREADEQRYAALVTRFGSADRDVIAVKFLAQQGDVARLAFEELAAAEWGSDGSATDGVLDKVLRGLKPEVLVEAAEGCLAAETCRRGAARAFQERRGFELVSREDYGRLLPKVAEVTLMEAEPRMCDFALWQLAMWNTPETTRLLWRVFDGELPTSLPSARVLALVALNAQRDEEGRLALEQFVPTTAAEATGLKFARALVGQVDRLTRVDLAEARTSLALAGIAAIRRFHRRDLLGLLVEGSLANGDLVVQDEAERVIKELIGPGAPADADSIRAWWKSSKKKPRLP